MIVRQAMGGLTLLATLLVLMGLSWTMEIAAYVIANVLYVRGPLTTAHSVHFRETTLHIFLIRPAIPTALTPSLTIPMLALGLMCA